MPDKNFLTQLENLLGVDEKLDSEVIDQLGVDEMLDLVDAVNKGHKNAANRIISDANEKEDVENDNLNRLFKHSDDEDEDDEEISYSEDDYLASVGDQVAVKMGDKVVKGTVKYAYGPSDTVGVMVKGKLKMIKRDRVKALNENFGGVMGMSPMPSLSRMQKLAGVTIVEPEPEIAPVSMEIVEPTTKLTPSNIVDVLDQIEDCIGDLRVADMKPVRERLHRLIQKLNESR